MKKLLLTIFILCPLLAFAADTTPSTFGYANGHFLLNGKEFVVKAAELHYARIPREYWDHRIKMCKALGMNTICAYVFWNFHEPQEGKFDFTGQHDLAAFMETCKKNGMWVIVRPGPYVCAEWEMGGLPWWLLKNKDVNLRTQDPKFFNYAVRFEKKVAEVLAPYRLENGGNIIMVQVENEYGSYAKDKPYVAAMRDALREAGWDKTQLFQCDWSSNFEYNALPDLLWTMNFGTGTNVLDQFKRVRQLRPDTPLMCSEFWSGWFDGWGTAHQTRSSDAMVGGIATMLENDISFSLYMTHGGTSFGWWAGANNTGYAPDCTSYDYDAPIDEQGSATPKYYQLRELLQKYSDKKLPDVPKPMKVITIPEFKFTEMAPLLRPGNMPEGVKTYDVKSVEQFNQGYGNVLYSTTLPALKAGSLLRINDMRDYAVVSIDGEVIGQLYRGNNFEKTLRLPKDIKDGAKLDIFIEVMGRINYSKLINDPKGITESVEVLTTDGKNELTYNLKDWTVYLYPHSEECKEAEAMSWVTVPQSIGENAGKGVCPAYYRSSFNLKKPADTYLDLSTWGKGMVWVNGHCLGRFWNVGPQQTMYLPGCWLRKGRNDIIVLDITGPSNPAMSGVGKPCVDQLHREYLPKDGVKDAESFFGRQRTIKQKMIDSVGNDAAPGAK